MIVVVVAGVATVHRFENVRKTFLRELLPRNLLLTLAAIARTVLNFPQSFRRAYRLVDAEQTFSSYSSNRSSPTVRLFFVFLFTSQRSCEKSNQDLLLSVFSVLPLSLDGNLWRIRNYLKNSLLRQNIPFLNTKTFLVFCFSSMFFAIFGFFRPFQYTVDQQSTLQRLRPSPPPLRCDRGARSLFVVYIDPRTRPCHLLLISRRQAVDSIGEIHPQTIIYFTKLVFLVSIHEPHCKRCEIS